MLQACLNGGRGHPAPSTPTALAVWARDVVTAGAEELHLHPRDDFGAETLDPASVAEALKAVRAAVPGIPVGIGTGHWIAPGGRKRHALMRDWQVLPDYVSVNLCEEDAPEVMTMMTEMEIGIEAGLWSRTDADRFVALAPPVLRVLIEMQDVALDAAQAEAEAVLDCLDRAGHKVPRLLHGEGDSAWAMVEMAARRGLDTRIGLEDVTTLPDGLPAQSNAQLVAAANRIIKGTSS